MSDKWALVMDEDKMQEETELICEELRKRGACTTLALARALGYERSADVNPLVSLLFGKKVISRVTDTPPIWTLSPTFPLPAAVAAMAPTVVAAPEYMGLPAPVAAAAAPAPDAALAVAPAPTLAPISAAAAAPVSVPAQPASIHAVVPFKLQLPADFGVGAVSPVANFDGGLAGPLSPANQKSKKHKGLTDLQLQLLKELKERGPTRTLHLAKIVGLVTCRDVNPSMYDLQRRKLVLKINNTPPMWQLNEPGAQIAQNRAFVTQGSPFNYPEIDGDDDPIKESLDDSDNDYLTTSVQPAPHGMQVH